MKTDTIKNKTMLLMSLGLLISCASLSLKAVPESTPVAVDTSAALTQTVQNTATQTAQQATDSIKEVAAKSNQSITEWFAEKYEAFKAWLNKPMSSANAKTSSTHVINTAERKAQ
ncbi:MAG: hypothetical protein NT124_02255 [Candidatus Dependentiae bacterium]|nr:hypothetical protein [Candidatus Dependentiae bacterium]